MTGTIKTPSQVKKAMTLREAGYSLAAIADKTDISVSTLARHFKKHAVGKGTLSAKAVADAKAELLSDAGFIEELKHQIAGSITDDIAQAKAIRETIALTLESLRTDPDMDAALKSRALSALATSTLTTQSISRKALKIEDFNAEHENDNLPELVIRKMSPADIERAISTAATDMEV